VSTSIENLEFDSCQGNVRDFIKSLKFQGKNLVRESGLKLFIVSCIYAYLFAVFKIVLTADLLHFILLQILHCCKILPTPLTITLVQA